MGATAPLCGELRLFHPIAVGAVNLKFDQVELSNSISEKLFLALSSVHAVFGTEGPRTMQLKGKIQGHDVATLVDSSSSNTFISQSIASSLSSVVSDSKTLASIADEDHRYCAFNFSDL